MCPATRRTSTGGRPLRDVYPGEDWTFWQYSGTGLVPGIEGEVDLNASSGSRWAWKFWLQRNTH